MMKLMKLKQSSGILWRSLIVGIGYMLALIIAERIIPILGITLPVAHGNVTNWIWIFLLSGFLTGIVASILLGYGSHYSNNMAEKTKGK